MITKELKLILLDIADLLIDIVDCSAVYGSAKSKKLKRLIENIGKIKESK